MFGAAGTGGFSNYNTSVGAFNSPAVDIIIGVFMALFGVNFSIYYYILRRNWKQCLKNGELRLYVALLLGSSVIIALNILPQYGYDFFHALRFSFFQVSSVMTTTGYSTANFDLWPQLSRGILVTLMVIGACAGSTGGGVKVIRVQLLLKSMVREVRRTIHPKSVNTIKQDGHAVDEQMLSGVMSFFFAYMLVTIVSTLIVSLDGFSFETNLTAVIATLSNIGPGLGTVGPMGNFSAVFRPEQDRAEPVHAHRQAGDLSDPHARIAKRLAKVLTRQYISSRAQFLRRGCLCAKFPGVLRVWMKMAHCGEKRILLPRIILMDDKRRSHIYVFLRLWQRNHLPQPRGGRQKTINCFSSCFPLSPSGFRLHWLPSLPQSFPSRRGLTCHYGRCNGCILHPKQN